MCMSHVDIVAEREAEAIERLAELLDEPVPMTGVQRARIQSIEAAERGLPRVKPCHYDRPAAIRAFDRLFTRMAVGDYRPPRIVWATREEKARRLVQRAKRADRVAVLAQMVGRGVGPLDRATAAQVSGISERSLFKAAKSGEVHTVRINGRRYFEVEGLYRWLNRRLAPRVNRRWLQPINTGGAPIPDSAAS